MSPRPEMSVGAVLLGLMAAALVVGIVAITVSRAGSGGESSAAAQSVADRPAGATSRAPTQPRPTTTAVPTEAPTATRAPAPTRAPAISRAAVIAVLQEYVDAYDAEDTAALGGLLAPHVSRHSGRSVQHGATEALAEYQQQFDELVAPHYVLDNLSFASTAADARIGATYSITSDEAPESTGSIGFHLSRSSAGLRIDAIVAVPG
jgi:hypothetical protein